MAVGDGPAGVCANCGKHGSDTVKLKNCTACCLVKYCGVICQKAHRKQHKKACTKCAAELEDEQLYSQDQRGRRGGLLPDLHSANSDPYGTAFLFPRMLHEIDL